MKAFGIRGLLVLCVAAFSAGTGCGGDEDTTAGFIGEWQFTSGTTNTKCPTLNIDQNDQLAGDKFRIGKGIDAALVYSEPDTSCTWKMTVNGNVATIMSGQSCTFTRPDGISYTGMYTAGTFSVSGTTAQYSGSQTAMVNIQSQVHNCSSTGSGGLMKVSQ